jgi:hypothetical protein
MKATTTDKRLDKGPGIFDGAEPAEKLVPALTDISPL